MNTDEFIWDFAKWRFLQGEARLWIYSNKILEVMFFLSLTLWLYLEFFLMSNSPLTYVSLLTTVLLFVKVRTRISKYQGFFDEYERGFEDAATRNCDYWSKTHSEQSATYALEETVSEIKKNEEIISLENLNIRKEEIEQGYQKLLGLLLSWKELKPRNN